MNIKGKITISTVRSSDPRGNWVRISLEDENSHIHFAEINIDFKQFGKAVVGNIAQSCDMELGGLEFLGKKRESKTEFVMLLRNATEMERGSIINSYEVDGWMGSILDLANHHNYIVDKSDEYYECYKVSFYRYIDNELEEGGK